MDEKNVFMANIREALGFSVSEERRPEQCSAIFSSVDDTEILERIRYRTDVEKRALLKILQDNGEQINLSVHPVPSFESAAEKIVNIVKSTSPEFGSTSQVIQHDHPDIVKLQLWKKLAGEAVLIHTVYPEDKEIREKTISSYIGITAPQWGIADSASIVQLTESGQPRSTSLVPSIHLALLKLKNILADLSELYALLQKNPPLDSFVFISGPSKTADIEGQMVHGAHGPREMHLIVIDEGMVQEVTFQGTGLFTSE